MRQPHRKRVRHFDEPGHVHELTFSCYRRMPLLTNDEWRAELCTAIDRAVVRHNYRLLAFVLMPEHVHLVVHPDRDGSPASDLLRAIKRPYSYRIKQRLTESESRLLERLTVRQRPGVMTFRYWQEGPGYDRKLTQPKRFWQPSTTSTRTPSVADWLCGPLTGDGRVPAGIFFRTP